LSSFLLLSPLLEPSLLFFLLSVRSLLGAVAVTPPQKKEFMLLICCVKGLVLLSCGMEEVVGCVRSVCVQQASCRVIVASGM